MRFVQALRSENAKSLTASKWSLLIVVVVNVATIILLYSPPALSWIFLSLGLALQVAGFALHLKSESHFRHARMLRHWALMDDGLRVNPSPTQLALLSISIGDARSSANLKYYTSNELPSERRLVDDIAESAFFSLNIAERVASYLTWSAVVFGLLIFYVLVILVFNASSTTQIKLVTQVSLLIFSFIGTGEFAILGFRFRQAYDQGREILSECDRILSSASISVIDAMSILCQYELMMSNCPPLPTWIYDKKRKRLDDAWLSRSRESASVQSSSHPA